MSEMSGAGRTGPINLVCDLSGNNLESAAGAFNNDAIGGVFYGTN
ncbi:MAG: hypothetical protein ABJO29_14075 [Yoonia sp.]